jgi:hypothetical protein
VQAALSNRQPPRWASSHPTDGGTDIVGAWRRRGYDLRAFEEVGGLGDSRPQPIVGGAAFNPSADTHE